MREVLKEQEKRELKIIPGMTEKHLQPAKFEKMRVNVACKVCGIILLSNIKHNVSWKLKCVHQQCTL